MKKVNKFECLVQVYDPNVITPPFEFITIDKFSVDIPKVDDLGVTKARILERGCIQRGYSMRFYSCGDKKDQLHIVVHNAGSPGTSEWYPYDHIKEINNNVS